LSVLELTCALSENDRTRAILSGEIQPEAIKLNSTAMHPSEMFFRQLHHAEFDVSEMSISSLTIATAKAPTEWVGIPVFTARKFFHTGVLIRTDRGITKPADLAGKKVGVPEFQQTAALWTRGVLRDEYGVQPASMEWFMERNPDQSHGGATGFDPAKAGIKLSYVPKETNLGEMIVAGKLDALIHYIAGQNLVDRSTVDPLADKNVKRLFDPPSGEAHRYFKKTGIYPINHMMVVRRSIAEKHPWVVLNIFNAFQKAKDALVPELDLLLEPYYAVGTVDGAARKALHTDVMPYGVKSAQKVLESITRFVQEDGLANRRVALDELFAKQTLDL
jgi:4,5-dihydroxyphthalate decarboxylase